MNEQLVPTREARVEHDAGRRADGSRQRAVLTLLAVGVLLVADGPTGPTGSPASPAAVSAAPLALSLEQVSSHLGAVNPSLSEHQRLRIARAVVRYSAKYELDPALVLGVIMAESSARPWARSAKGAIGLMQVMPYMMGSLDVAGNLTTVESNIEAGCLILADNIRRLGERRGILAYFWGNDIRGARYFERVQAARAEVRRRAAS